MVESSLYHLSHTISKQLLSAHAPNPTPEPEIITTSSSPEPEHYNFDNCNLAGQKKVIFCKSCGKQLTPFQVETYLITRADDPDRGLCSDCSCPDPRKKYGSAIIEKNLRALKKF